MSKPKLSKRKDGRYRCYYKGKQFYGKTQAEAYAARDEYKAKLAEGINPDKVTVAEYAMKWLPIAKSDVSNRTYNGNAKMLEIACEEIGDYTFPDVKPLDIKAIYTKHFSGMSESYIRHARSLYIKLFDAAVDDGYIRSNPCRAESAKPHKGGKKSHRAITKEERNAIETMALNHKVRPIAMLMLYAGLRPAEAVPMRAENIDRIHDIIHVCEFSHCGNNYNQRYVDSKGKTEKSTRDIPLLSPLKKALEGIDNGYLISKRNGEVLSILGWYNAWKSYRKAIEAEMNGMSLARYNKLKEKNADLPEWKAFTVVPYDLRHSFITWCRDNGVELHTLIEWCGHTDSKMIMQIYDEVSVDRSKAEQRKLEEIIRFETNKNV